MTTKYWVIYVQSEEEVPILASLLKQLGFKHNRHFDKKFNQGFEKGFINKKIVQITWRARI